MATELTVRGQPVVVRCRAGNPGVRPIVLVHGWSVTGALNWLAAFDRLADDRPLVAVDLPGHGCTPRRGPFRLTRSADIVAGVVTELELQRPLVAGYSLGGMVVQHLARRYEPILGGLILICTTARLAADPFAAARVPGLTALAAAGGLVPGAVRRQLVAQVRRHAFDGQVPRPEADEGWRARELGAYDSRAALEALAAAHRHDARRWLGRITVPCVVIETTQDRIIPAAHQHDLALRIPRAHLELVHGSHLAAVEVPEDFWNTFQRACTWLDERLDHRVPTKEQSS